MLYAIVSFFVICAAVSAENRTFDCSFESACPQLVADDGLSWSATDGVHAPTDYFPKVDHTLGNSSGWYMFLTMPNDASPVFEMSGTFETRANLRYYPTQYCLSFAYAMSGAKPSLTVQFHQSNYVKYTAVTLWNANYPPTWDTYRLVLPADDFTVRLTATISQKESPEVIAIDDVKIEACGTNHAPMVETLCSFEGSTTTTTTAASDVNYSRSTGSTCESTQGAFSSQAWELGRGADHIPETPTIDATTGTSQGHYMYAKANGKNSTAYLDFPALNLSDTTEPWCLSFNLWISHYMPEQSWVKLVVLNITDPHNGSILWQMENSDALAGPWKPTSIPIADGPVLYRFIMANALSTFAIDDVSIKQCPSGKDPAHAHRTAIFEQSICDFEDTVSCAGWTSNINCQWNMIVVEAGTAGAPKTDHTFGNSSGHVFLANFAPPYTRGNAACANTPYFLSSAYCVELWYFMDGHPNTEASIVALTGGSIGGRTWEGPTGNKGDKWNRAFFRVLDGNVWLTLSVQLNSFVPNIVAFDDIRIDHCLAFEPKTTTVHTPSTTVATTQTTSATTPTTLTSETTASTSSVTTASSNTTHPQTHSNPPVRTTTPSTDVAVSISTPWALLLLAVPIAWYNMKLLELQ